MRRPVKNRSVVAADRKFENYFVAKFINYIMIGGKKTVAQDIVYGAFDYIKTKTEKEGLEVFNTAIENVSPTVEVRSKRVGGANYQVPVEVRPERRMQLAFRWLITGARNKKGEPMYKKIGDELIAASNGEGNAVKKREDVHRMAEANKAFAHFA